MKKKTLFLLICSMLLAGCGRTPSDTDGPRKEDPGNSDLMQNISANKVSEDPDLHGPGSIAVTDFGIRLLQNTIAQGENTLVSPLSVICALGMTENGGQKETLEQMENTLGMPCQELNAYLAAFVRSLPASDKYRLSSANSIWLRKDENFTVRQDFLQTNADWYGAGIFEDAFDASTVKRINDWVKENTHDMIPEILSEIPDDAVMYLVNALAFEAEWETIYTEDEIIEDTFTRENGTEQTVEFMSSEEDQFLKDGQASGFLKYYSDRKYAFAALLPDKDVGLEDYAASLTGEKLRALLANKTDKTVYARIPKFSCEYKAELKPVLTAMGIQDAFSPEMADFSRLGSHSRGNLYINEVFHNTFINVDERGTKAGAATMVEMMVEMAMVETENVYLDRPFLYMLIDCETDIPLFIGVVNSIDQ